MAAVSADTSMAGALRALANALDEIPALSMIIGGIAVIAAGVPRETIDIDATILGRTSDLELVLDALARQEIVPRIDDAIRFARERQLLLLRHEPSGVTMEISFAWLPFEEEALSRAVTTDFSGVSLRVAIPEDLIVYKATAWRDRDRSDIERLLTLHGDQIDLDRVRRLIVEIAAVLEDPERVALFDAIVARSRSTG
jgi:Nucleotidyltransferase of unknown function (DUF6036)